MTDAAHPISRWRSRTGILSILVGVAVGGGIGFLLGAAKTGSRTVPGSNSPLKTAPSVAPLERSSNIQSPGAAKVTLQELLASASSRDGFGDLPVAEAVAIIRELPLTECHRTLQQLRRVQHGDRQILMDALARRWALLDPAGAFNNAQRERSDNDWSNRIGFAAGAALAAIDPQASLDRITSARNNDLREKAAEWVLPALARTQPAVASHYLATNKFLARHFHIFRNVAQEFGRVAPREAIAWADSLSEVAGVPGRDRTSWRDQLVTSAWSGWAEADPIACAAAISATEDKARLENVIGTVARAWSQKDISAALAWAESIPDERSKSAALRSLDIDIYSLGSEAARNLVTSISSENVRVEYASRIAQELAREDIQGALGWAGSLPQGEVRDKAMEPVLNHWASTDPVAAVAYLATLPPSKEREQLLARASSVWSENDPEAAFSYTRQLPAGKERDSAAGQAIRQIRERDPQKALEWFSTVEDTEVRGSIARELVGSLVKTDPPTALRLAEQVPAESKPEAYHSLIRNWAFEHPQEAGDWLNNLSPGLARDSAVKAYVSVIDGTDPALATKWANSVTDPVERFESLFRAYSRWIQKDRSAASAWVAENEVPEGFRPILDRLANDKKYFDQMND